MSSLRIVNANALLPEGLVEGVELGVRDGIFDTARAGALIWDARGLLVLPGIVDLHGDAFERQVMPRPGVFFADEIALFDTDRQLVANGITTAFHALTWSWEPGLRSTARATAFVDSLERLRPQLACDTRLHLRWETFNLDALALAETWLAAGRVDLFAFNDHTTGLLRAARGPAHMAKTVERTGLKATDFEVLLARIGELAADVSTANAQLASIARSANVPLASHDDLSPACRATFRDLGCRISEFPITRETAQAARDNGDHVMMGAPNVVRGGSHLSLVSAESLVRAGLCDLLASDYYYPALLQAAWRLAGSAAEISAFWPLVSRNPALAVGLADRGHLRQGARADFIAVDVRSGVPRVAATFVGGRLVYEAAHLGALAA
jgi:alpha-D-ribose 1-methylphosphonate 5-triphosphate diphosphatase